MLRDYYQLTKPGIIYGNAITVVAGFFLASKGNIDWSLLVVTLLGISLVMASGCVFNNFIDRDIDALMERTKNRALVKGTISLRSVLVFATLLGVAGITTLFIHTNTLTALAALFGFFAYVVLYSLWSKRQSVYGTTVGSISGAVPPVVGYLAVINNLDLGAIILFLILVLWQMPHFFAIAIYRLEDYAKAGIPVLPVKKGIRATKIQMMAYITLFILATLALSVFGYVGYSYFFVMILLGIVWLSFSIKGFYATNDKLWARKMFIFSIIILIIFSIMIAFDVVK